MSELLRRFSSPDSFLDLPGGRVATWRFGNGPDLVAVHGFPLHAATWRHLVPGLARHFTVHLLRISPAQATPSGQGRWTSRPPPRPCMPSSTASGSGATPCSRTTAAESIARLACAGDERLAAMVLGNTEIPDHHGLLFQVFVQAARRGLAGPMLRAISRPPLRDTALGLGPLFTDPSYMDGEFGELFLAPLRDPRVLASQVRVLAAFDPG